MKDVVQPKQIAASLQDYWAPRVIGEMDDDYVKVAKIKGQFTWHAHDDEDEMFLVLKGSMQIEFEHETINLAEGEMFIVPKGVRHRPVAENECLILLIEKKSTHHTGGVVGKQTRTVEEQLGQG